MKEIILARLNEDVKRLQDYCNSKELTSGKSLEFYHDFLDLSELTEIKRLTKMSALMCGAFSGLFTSWKFVKKYESTGELSHLLLACSEINHAIERVKKAMVVFEEQQ